MAVSALVLLTLVALSSGRHVGSEDKTLSVLENNLLDFINEFPGEEVYETIMNYIATDKDVHNMCFYIQDDDFRMLLIKFEAVPEFTAILDYIQARNIDVYYLVNEFNKRYYNLDPLTPTEARSLQQGKGFVGMIKDIEALMPENKLKSMFEDKMKNSAEYAQWVKTVRGEEFNTLVMNLLASPMFQSINEVLMFHKIDISSLWDLLNKMLGWGYV